MKNYKRALPFLGAAMLAGAGLGAMNGCDTVTDACGLDCDAEAYVNGQASISGVAEIDAFFSAALELETAMNTTAADIRAELDAMAVSVGLEPGAAGADIAGAVNARFDAAGSVTIDFKPPRCEASVEVSAQAAAECDVMVDPGEVSVACEGSCEVEAGVAVDCGAEANLRCTGTAPNLQCDGMCSGTCAADVSGGATCEGTCKGTCSGECSLTNTSGECEGKCMGTCTGTCEVELKAEAMCNGECQGQCTYTPPEGMCEASASAKCEAMAEGSVECEGKCEGNFEPPSVSAECEASVEAKAKAKAECKPPELAIVIEFDANFDASARAEFKAWLEGFKGHYSALLALRARADLIVDAALGLSAAAEGAVSATFDTLAVEGDFKAKFGGACALKNLPDAISGIGSATTNVQGELSAAVEVTGAISG